MDFFPQIVAGLIPVLSDVGQIVENLENVSAISMLSKALQGTHN